MTWFVWLEQVKKHSKQDNRFRTIKSEGKAKIMVVVF